MMAAAMLRARNSAERRWRIRGGENKEEEEEERKDKEEEHVVHLLQIPLEAAFIRESVLSLVHPLTLYIWKAFPVSVRFQLS